MDEKQIVIRARLILISRFLDIFLFVSMIQTSRNLHIPRGAKCSFEKHFYVTISRIYCACTGRVPFIGPDKPPNVTTNLFAPRSEVAFNASYYKRIRDKTIIDFFPCSVQINKIFISVAWNSWGKNGGLFKDWQEIVLRLQIIYKRKVALFAILLDLLMLF